MSNQDSVRADVMWHKGHVYMTNSIADASIQLKCPYQVSLQTARPCHSVILFSTLMVIIMLERSLFHHDEFTWYSERQDGKLLTCMLPPAGDSSPDVGGASVLHHQAVLVEVPIYVGDVLRGHQLRHLQSHTQTAVVQDAQVTHR